MVHQILFKNLSGSEIILGICTRNDHYFFVDCKGIFKKIFRKIFQKMDKLLYYRHHIPFGMTILVVFKKQHLAYNRIDHCSRHVIFTVTFVELVYKFLMFLICDTLQQSHEENIKKWSTRLSRFLVVAKLRKKKVSRSPAEIALFFNKILILVKAFAVDFVTTSPETESERVSFEDGLGD